ncbi:Glutathione S-transferase [Aphelenchoides fujianensis]|nr:Glutathione S-transferase [Aphelenchoides fujianensis]
MPTYKLHYFESRGLAETARMIFAHAGVDYEDVRHEHGNFKKADFPFGKLPVLEVDGKKLPESMALTRYLAKQHGLAGKNDWESAEIDAIVYFEHCDRVHLLPKIKEWVAKRPDTKF